MWNPIGRSEFDKDMHMWVKDCIFKHFFSDQPTKKSLEFTPGIIVKFSVNEPIEDEKKVKQRIRAAVMENVSYVDARIGQRFVSSIGNMGNSILFLKLFGPILWEKTLWNSRLKAKNLQKVLDHYNNLFKQWKVRTVFGKGILFWLVPGGFSYLMI